MDPLSVSASIFGLLAAAGKVTSILTRITNAPALARIILSEMSDVTAALGQLQGYVIGSVDVSPARTSLIQLDQVLATLTSCVTTYSELEAILDSLEIIPELGKFNRVKWSLKEPDIMALVQRLQNSKASLTLMLTILQCKFTQEAETSMQKLQTSVDKLLDNNAELLARLRGLEEGRSVTSWREDDRASTVKSYRTSRTLKNRLSLSAITRSMGFAFETDLLSSRVYQKAKYRHSQTSSTSLALFSASLSVFSKLSLAQISNISVYALPIYPADLHNDRWYTFGEVGAEAAIISSNTLTLEAGSVSAQPELQKVHLKDQETHIETIVRPSDLKPAVVVHTMDDPFNTEQQAFPDFRKEWQKVMSLQTISEASIQPSDLENTVSMGSSGDKSVSPPLALKDAGISPPISASDPRQSWQLFSFENPRVPPPIPSDKTLKNSQDPLLVPFPESYVRASIAWM